MRLATATVGLPRAKPTEFSRFVFVLEQTQGHAAHSRNLERRIRSDDRFEADLIYVGQETSGATARIPVLRNWSLQASSVARSELKRRLAHRTPDGLFIHTQVAALRATDIMRRVPTVISMDATPKNYDALNAYRHRTHPRVVERIKTMVNSRAFRAARALAPWSNWAADSLVNDYGVQPDSVHVIRPGVDLALFRPRTGPRRPGPVRILFVGGDFERKGGPQLVKAVESLGDRAELHLVTKSEVRPMPSGLYWHVYRDVGPQTPKLVRLFREADLFVLPTKAECYGIVIAEAMACGLPVISSPVGAIPELVRDGVNGYLVDPGSTEGLRSAITKLVDEPELRTGMGQASLETARREHDLDSTFTAITELLFDIRDRS